jgi:glycosyltransferase involved in cell wall biosynthesis
VTRPLIAIDATSVPARPAGAGRYALSLVKALARVDSDHDYVVYARSHSLPALAGLRGTMRVVDVGPLSRGRRYFWEQTAHPRDLRRRRVALLHSPHHTMPYAFVPCPRIVTIHDVTFFLIPERYPPTRRFFFQYATRLSVRLASAVIVPSQSAKKDLWGAIHQARRPPTYVTYEGVDDSFRPLDRDQCQKLASERHRLPPGYLLSVGTREPGKNRTTLLQALQRLVRDGRDLHLAIVGGSGWLHEEEEAEIDELGLRGHVHFTGYVPDEHLPALYNAAKVFVFPSLHEGFGLPVLEAMASGTPVVTSNRSSLPEVAGDAALLVDPTNADEIAGTVARILDEPALASGLRKQGLARAASFTWDDCARATVDVYRRVLGEA